MPEPKVPAAEAGLRPLGWDEYFDKEAEEFRAAGCRHADCAHVKETGCAVRAAAASGALPAERYESYLKLRKELAFLETWQREKPAQEFRFVLRRLSTHSWRRFCLTSSWGVIDRRIVWSQV